MTRETFSEAARQRSFREVEAAVRKASRQAISNLKKSGSKSKSIKLFSTRAPRKFGGAKLWSGVQKSPSTLLKIHRGGLYGVRYALSKGRLLDTNMVSRTALEFLREFALDQARAPRVKKDLFIHKSISFHKSISLTDEARKAHVKRYLKEAGFDGCQYLLVAHDDTDSPHIHVLVSRLKNDGTLVSMSNNFYRWRAALRSAERESGLPEFVVSDSVSEGQSDRKVNTMRRSERVENGKNWVHKSAVIEAKNASKNMPEFQTELKKRGLEMELSKRADRTTTGLMIRSVGSDRFLSASSIDRSVTLPKLQAHWDQMATPVKPGLPVRPAHAPGQRPLPVPAQQPHTPRQRGG